MRFFYRLFFLCLCGQVHAAESSALAVDVSSARKRPVVSILASDKKRLDRGYRVNQLDSSVASVKEKFELNPFKGVLAPCDGTALFKRRQEKAAQKESVKEGQLMSSEEDLQKDVIVRDYRLEALIGAVRTGNFEGVRNSIRLDRNVVRRSDSKGWTALHWAVSSPNKTVEDLLSSGQIYRTVDRDIVAYIVSAGAAINALTKTVYEGEGFVGGNTPLSLATLLGRTAIVRDLLEKGANAFISNAIGFKPHQRFEALRIAF